MSTALVLAGHGSHISPHTAGLVWSFVDRLRALGVADEVTAAFWKESPPFHTVLTTLLSDDVTIVPLFTAQGYFTQTVIPAEFGLDGILTRRAGRTIRYAKTLSEHPYLAEIVRERVQEGLTALGSLPQETAVAILGHSTRRNPESRAATEAQAAQIREAHLASEVVAAYLDDTPGIADVYTMTHAPSLIAVPYFLAPGSHTTIDVPRELALEPGQTRAEIYGRTVYYTQPVGTESALINVIIELARDTGTSFYPARDASSWESFPMAGRAELTAAVELAGTIQFGELCLSLSDVRPLGENDDGLATVEDLIRLRKVVREQPFRPLPTSLDLPRGWRVPIDGDTAKLHAVVETVYPGAVADWAAHLNGTFVAEPLAATLRRQTGMFRKLNRLKTDQRASRVKTVCGHCARHATWHHGASPTGVVPCPEACNVWLSQALETMD